jgi:hydrogenase-4 component B
MLTVVLSSIALLCASALAAACASRSNRLALGIGTAGSIIASVAGGTAAIIALLRGELLALRAWWSIPVGQLHVALDPLSAFFLICVFLISGLAALYGSGYLRAYIGRRRLAPAVVFFNLLVAAMAALIIARDGILFLICWEVMSIASFFLVTFESEREDVRRAGMTYLIASHLGTVFIFILFALLSRSSGLYDFDVFASGQPPAAGLASLCFLLAVIGFGSKAGFWPMHIWLPDAHPAAPSHVSALMSGVMIKMGIYGLLRTLTFMGSPPEWWGTVLIAIGAISGIAGVLHALAQHDLKRLLAYHSVENIGIIALGIGVGLLGQSHGDRSITFLGYAGALLHVLNHGLFKGLLFKGAGTVLHATGSRNIDSMGGLYRSMPTTATCFLVGSVAICGLPPLNGFVSEWLIFMGAFEGSSNLPTAWAVSALIPIPALALIGGLACACFVKAFGVVFLGEPRAPAESPAHEAGIAMRAPMILGALLCVLIGLWPSGAVWLVAPAAASVAGIPDAPSDAIGPLTDITRVAAWLTILIAFLALLRLALLRLALLQGRKVAQAVTWGCGYSSPTPRMQYTAGSFAEPLLAPFASVIQARVHREGPAGYFPTKAYFEEHLGDPAGERLLIPATRRVVRALARLRVIQQGRLQLYLVYIAVTLVVLLIWQIMEAGR